MSTAPLDYTPSSSARSPFLPVLLGLLAFLAWTLFQTVQLVSERSALNQTHARQVQALDQAEKARAAMDSLASKTQKLADSGNSSAQQIIAELKQRGITINPNAATPVPPR